MYILGISAFYHDSAACLLKNGEILAAAQEERFTRKKHDSCFPRNAIRYCLDEANISPSQIDNVVFYEKPFMKFERLLETYLAFAPKGFTSFARPPNSIITKTMGASHNFLRTLKKVHNSIKNSNFYLS